MKYLSLILACTGLLLLITLLYLLPAKDISSSKELKDLIVGQKLTSTGLVIEEKFYEKNRKLTLDNGIVIDCTCNYQKPFLKSKIKFTGKLERYAGKETIKVRKVFYVS